MSEIRYPLAELQGRPTATAATVQWGNIPGNGPAILPGAIFNLQDFIQLLQASLPMDPATRPVEGYATDSLVFAFPQEAGEPEQP